VLEQKPKDLEITRTEFKVQVPSQESPNKCLQCQNIKTRTKCDETLPTINKPKAPEEKKGRG
jgi:hypothetical protein